MGKKKKKKVWAKPVIVTPEEQKKEEQKKFSVQAKARARAERQEKNKEPIRKRIANYFRGVKTETRKVVWPTRKETVSYTITVLIACAFFGITLWILDTAFLSAIQTVFK